MGEPMSIKETIQNLHSFQQRSNDAFLRWRVDLSIDDSMDIVRKIGRMYESNFTIDNENEFVYRNLVKWVNGDDTLQSLDPKTQRPIHGNRKGGIYLAGTTGSGKTLCMEIIKAYATYVNARIQIYPHEPRILSWQPIHAAYIVEAYACTGNLNGVDDADILFIEDLGCESESVSYMGNKTDVMRRILEYRGDYSNKLTLFTTNLPMMDDWTKNRYGSRVISRLGTMNYYELKGIDRRLAK